MWISLSEHPHLCALHYELLFTFNYLYSYHTSSHLNGSSLFIVSSILYQPIFSISIPATINLNFAYFSNSNKITFKSNISECFQLKLLRNSRIFEQICRFFSHNFEKRLPFFNTKFFKSASQHLEGIICHASQRRIYTSRVKITPSRTMRNSKIFIRT